MVNSIVTMVFFIIDCDTSSNHRAELYLPFFPPWPNSSAAALWDVFAAEGYCTLYCRGVVNFTGSLTGMRPSTSQIKCCPEQHCVQPRPAFFCVTVMHQRSDHYGDAHFASSSLSSSLVFCLFTITSGATKGSGWISKYLVGNPPAWVGFPTTG